VAAEVIVCELFVYGATNDNLEEVLKQIQNVAGIKIFLGSSTGNMLVDNEATLEKIFSVHQCLLLFIVKMKLLYKTI
jgi:dihydroorotase-like cyclic amidohydrolase